MICFGQIVYRYSDEIDERRKHLTTLKRCFMVSTARNEKKTPRNFQRRGASSIRLTDKISIVVSKIHKFVSRRRRFVERQHLGMSSNIIHLSAEWGNIKCSQLSCRERRKNNSSEKCCVSGRASEKRRKNYELFGKRMLTAHTHTIQRTKWKETVAKVNLWCYCLSGMYFL